MEAPWLGPSADEQVEKEFVNNTVGPSTLVAGLLPARTHPKTLSRRRSRANERFSLLRPWLNRALEFFRTPVR